MRDSAPCGSSIAEFTLPRGETVNAVLDERNRSVWVPFDLDEAFTNYVSEGWRRHDAPRGLSSGQLKLYYRMKPLIPRRVQLAARRMLARPSRIPEFPRWPIEDGVLSLLRFYAYCLLVALDVDTLPFRWFWPDAHGAALMLTHDVESGEGLQRALAIADLEQERGFRSSFNIVAAWYPIDYGIVRELKSRGFEIGLHGLKHDHSLFVSREAFVRQLPAIVDAADVLGAEGFRSPATHRVHEWLGELPLRYDTSVPHSDPFEPQPGGCCTLWPYTIGNIVELPYTMSQDHTLFTLLRERSVDPWLQQVDAIEQRGGLIQCVSHPDPGYLGDADKRALYVELLDALAEHRTLWRALPREVSAWWRRRQHADPADPALASGTIVRGEGHAVLLPPAPDGRQVPVRPAQYDERY